MTYDCPEKAGGLARAKKINVPCYLYRHMLIPLPTRFRSTKLQLGDYKMSCHEQISMTRAELSDTGLH